MKIAPSLIPPFRTGQVISAGDLNRLVNAINRAVNLNGPDNRVRRQQWGIDAGGTSIYELEFVRYDGLALICIGPDGKEEVAIQTYRYPVALPSMMDYLPIIEPGDIVPVADVLVEGSPAPKCLLTFVGACST